MRSTTGTCGGLRGADRPFELVGFWALFGAFLGPLVLDGWMFGRLRGPTLVEMDLGRACQMPYFPISLVLCMITSQPYSRAKIATASNMETGGIGISYFCISLSLCTSYLTASKGCRY